MIVPNKPGKRGPYKPKPRPDVEETPAGGTGYPQPGKHPAPGGVIGPPSGQPPWTGVYPPGTIQNNRGLGLSPLVLRLLINTGGLPLRPPLRANLGEPETPVRIPGLPGGGTVSPGDVDYPDLIGLVGRAVDPGEEGALLGGIHGGQYPPGTIQNYRLHPVVHALIRAGVL